MAEINEIYDIWQSGQNRIGEANYNVAADLTRSGAVGQADYDLAVAQGTKTALARGRLSAADNVVGYAGRRHALPVAA